MSHNRVVALVCILPLLVFSVSDASAQSISGWEHYRPGTIAAVIQQHDSTIRADHDPKLPSLVISGNRFPTFARVRYCGDSRPIDSKRVDLLRRWGLAFRRDTAIVMDYRREYLFQEGERLLWLPVQDTVASFFAAELKPGQRVGLYVMWAGAHYFGKDITWTFLVNEFEAGSPGTGCDAQAARKENGLRFELTDGALAVVES